ncbi:hypothetical protein [Aquipuribacter nitratireducens]|uniref:DUF559 domain-containing protein n=1 Tax=Aquipuribacter nitratireducens TaxID=650104 RepID=A0ABW0GKF7_9MICO
MSTPVTVVAALGTATYPELMEHVSRRSLRTALSRGEVVRVRRGRYALPSATGGVRRALELGGALSGLSAAEHHGWGVLHRSSGTEVTVPPTASRLVPGGATLRWGRLSSHERRDGVTDPLRTVLDCARTLPVPDALAVADSALRRGDVRRRDLRRAVEELAGRRSGRARLVLTHASSRAANAFESGLRGWCLVAGRRSLQPQVEIRSRHGDVAVVDLADVDAGVVLEADGYDTHGTRRAFALDLARHDWLQTDGWATRRFAWTHVMFDGRFVVRHVLGAYTEAAARQRGRRR